MFEPLTFTNRKQTQKIPQRDPMLPCLTTGMYRAEPRGRRARLKASIVPKLRVLSWGCQQMPRQTPELLQMLVCPPFLHCWRKGLEHLSRIL